MGEDLNAARENYARARGYRSGDLNAIDLYLIRTALNSNVSHRYRRQEMAGERARSRQTAIAVHHTGFGSSGSRSFGGGRMGGGSRGGGKW